MRTESFEDVAGRPFLRRFTRAGMDTRRTSSTFEGVVRCPTCGWSRKIGRRNGLGRAREISELLADAHRC